jgi:hypothetical protein
VSTKKEIKRAARALAGQAPSDDDGEVRILGYREWEVPHRRKATESEMKIPQVIHAESLVGQPWTATNIGGGWKPARPLPYHSIFARWKCAWLVLTGQADALVWRDQ